MSKDHDLEERVRKLLDKSNKPTVSEDELAQKFTTVFASQLISTLKKPNYFIPDNADQDDMDKQLEDLFEESDNDDIYADILQPKENQLYASLNRDMDALTDTFIGREQIEDTDEANELIQRIHHEAALDRKYSQFNKDRDEQLEKRYLELKKDAPSTWTSPKETHKPKGKVPTLLSTKDFEDEMDNWCCICNEDAVIECIDCEDDNRYCRGCFNYTHRSDSADYEATQHKSKMIK